MNSPNFNTNKFDVKADSLLIDINKEDLMLGTQQSSVEEI